ncbi:DUF4084 domain-containing protein [Paenibacillus sp. GCM10027628]|uniref:DUF4084 domain-containing protein n=1 Tax=Paenibacillus sp. GCM10027628 TaxID=3273413 RepID=UPI003633687E
MRKQALFFTFIYILAFYIWLYVFRDHGLMRMMGINLFPIIGGVISFYWLFRTYRSMTRKPRYFWLLLSIGTLSFIVAQGIWFSDQLHANGVNHYPSWADFFWLVQYGLFMIALIYKLMLIKGKSKLRSIFNMGIFMVTASTLSVHFLIQPILASTQHSIPGLIVSIAYPVFDLGFLFATISLYDAMSYSIHKKKLLLLTCGLFVQIIADTIHSYLISTGRYFPGSYIDPLWIFPLLFNGIAGSYAEHDSNAQWAGPKEYSKVRHGFKMVPYASVIVLLALVLLNEWNQRMNSLEIGLIVVMLLIIVRQIFIMMDNHDLLRELQEKHEELGKSEERYRQLVEISPNAICVETQGQIIYVNKAGLNLMGAAAPEEVVGKSAYDLVHGDYSEIIAQRHREVSAERHAAEPFEYPVRRLDGQIIVVESSLTEIHYNGEKAYLSVVQDITQRRKSEEKIKFMAYYDELTELPNRAMFYKQLTEHIEKAKHSSTAVAVVFVDLDRFKFINDTMGHSIGDLFLKQVSHRLNQLVDKNGTVYRHGGDEFCIVIGPANEAEVSELAERIIGGFSKPLFIEGHELFSSLSMGISMYPIHGDDAETLIRFADISMYNIKRQGGNSYRFYSETLDIEDSQKLNVENALRKAMEHREFIIHYQPKVNLHSGEIIGLEALVRWQHPEWGLVSPLRFISIAEETGLIVPIGRWVLQEACRQMKKWHEEGFSKLGIAVNISPRQCLDSNLITIVSQVLQETGLDPNYLEIEVTETIMQDVKESSFILSELKKLGVQIAIDDFGTGYSSLSYLKHLPIDHIKIDKSFVDEITTNPKDKAIIKTIIDMGNHLGIHVIAEGVENEQQLLALKKYQCHVGQGYFFSEPLPSDEVERLFKTN